MFSLWGYIHPKSRNDRETYRNQATREKDGGETLKLGFRLSQLRR